MAQHYICGGPVLSSIRLTGKSMTARAILAVITLVTGPNSTQLHLMQFMPVTHAINAMEIALTAILLII